MAVVSRSGFTDCAWLKSICIPASVHTICERCFPRTGIPRICHSNAVPDFRIWAKQCRTWFRALRESDFSDIRTGRQLSILGRRLFMYRRSIQSIGIPSSLETIGERCFDCCPALSQLTVESHSKLSVLGRSGFQSCDRPCIN
jgi:hypothetical protein